MIQIILYIHFKTFVEYYLNAKKKFTTSFSDQVWNFFDDKNSQQHPDRYNFIADDDVQLIPVSDNTTVSFTLPELHELSVVSFINLIISNLLIFLGIQARQTKEDSFAVLDIRGKLVTKANAIGRKSSHSIRKYVIPFYTSFLVIPSFDVISRLVMRE